MAGSESLVQTAGHCLNEGPGEFATNVVFIPQYRDGAAPFGQFTATELFTTEQWRTAGDLDYDVGYAKVGTANGSTLADAVGAQGIGFNLERGEEMYAFGYPAAAPYDEPPNPVADTLRSTGYVRLMNGSTSRVTNSAYSRPSGRRAIGLRSSSTGRYSRARRPSP